MNTPSRRQVTTHPLSAYSSFMTTPIMRRHLSPAEQFADILRSKSALRSIAARQQRLGPGLGSYVAISSCMDPPSWKTTLSLQAPPVGSGIVVLPREYSKHTYLEPSATATVLTQTQILTDHVPPLHADRNELKITFAMDKTHRPVRVLASVQATTKPTTGPPVTIALRCSEPTRLLDTSEVWMFTVLVGEEQRTKLCSMVGTEGLLTVSVEHATGPPSDRTFLLKWTCDDVTPILDTATSAPW